MSNGRQHGGEWALLGFYYQMLAILGIATLESEAIPSSDADTKLLLINFTSDKERILFPEQGGQDFTLIAGEGSILFQCKHSSNPVDRTVDMSEFRGVLEGFAHSLLYAETHSYQVIRGCILLTNRLPHDAVTELKEIVQQCRDALGWQNGQVGPIAQEISTYENLPVNFRKQKRPFRGTVKELVADWLSDKNRHGEIIEAPESTLVQAALRVLPTFYFLTETETLHFKELFATFARKYGATEDEIENAIARMLGQMLEASGRSKPLTLPDFVKAVTGRSDGKEMTPTGIGEPCAQSLRDWIADWEACPNWTIPRPAIQNKINQAYLEGKRIIFLIGSGGCGKTETLVEMLSQKVDQFNSASVFPGFVAIKSCSEVEPDWLEKSVGEWANRGSSPYQTIDMPIARLSIANPGLPSLLFIGLDGLDEKFPSQETLLDLIKKSRLHKDNDVILILTVRGSEYKEFCRFIYPHRSQTSVAPLDADIGWVTVDNFDEEEMLAVVAAGINQDLSDTIRRMCFVDNETSNSLFVSIASSYEEDLGNTSGDYTWIDSLKHPRMLGAFILAEQQCSGTAQEALNGDTTAKDRVAKMFVTRFLEKYTHRKQNREMPSVRSFASLIKEVAASTSNDSAALTESIWIDTAKQTVSMRQNDAEQLFNEAASGGLITIVDETASRREWEWNHTFVAAYLAVTQVGSFCPNE